MYKKLNDFNKRFNKLKTVDPLTDENKVLKPKVLDNVGDYFNELYYFYKDKCSEEKDSLKIKNFFTTKNWDLLMIINKSLKKKKKKKKNNRLVTKNHLKNQQKMMWVILMNGLVKKKHA